MRQDTLKTNFLGGELSPRLHGRPDLQKYGDAVKEARDVVIYQQGGATARPGSFYLGAVKDHTTKSRLIPFVRDVDTSYTLELGNNVMRVWYDGALVESSPGVPLEVATPWSWPQAFEMDYTQGADTMFCAHPSHPIYRIRRFSNTRWVVDQAPFIPAPFSEIGYRQATAITLGATSGSTTATAAASLWLDADVNRPLIYQGGSATVASLTSALIANVTITAAFGTTSLPSSGWQLGGSPQATCTPSAKDPVGATVTLALDKPGWRINDPGSHVLINGGLCRITSYTDSQNVYATIVTEMTSTTAAPPDAWSLESAVWNASDGYPATVTLHQQRLIAAGTARFPQTLWGSRSGLYYDFTKGADDDHSYSFELASDELNQIRFLSSNKDLLALTNGGEWVITGGVEKPITPSNIRAVPYAKSGAAVVRPEQVDDDVVYVQRGVSALRLLGYSLEYGGYRSAEMSTFSEHLFRAGITQVTFEQTPERVLWAMRSDGKYLAITMNKEQAVRSPTLCTPAGGGVVESMCTLPGLTSDVTSMVVSRVINGNTRRFVERMSWDVSLDCASVVIPVGTLVSGLGHLVGETVACVMDGVDLGDFVVNASGQITLPRERATDSNVYVGLRMAPSLTLLNAEVGNGMGASSGTKINTGRVRVLFKDTVGCNVNGQALQFRQTGEDVLDQAVPAFSGWKDISNFGWSSDSGEVNLSQPQAYPWTVLAVVRRTTANPG